MTANGDDNNKLDTRENPHTFTGRPNNKRVFYERCRGNTLFLIRSSFENTLYVFSILIYTRAYVYKYFYKVTRIIDVYIFRIFNIVFRWPKAPEYFCFDVN